VRNLSQRRLSRITCFGEQQIFERLVELATPSADHCSHNKDSAMTRHRTTHGDHTRTHTHTARPVHRSSHDAVRHKSLSGRVASRRQITRRSLSPAEAAACMIVGKLPVASLYRPSLLETETSETRLAGRVCACV